MPSQVTNYQCPACTGPLHFDSDTGKLKCDYCGSTYETAEIEQLYANKDKAAEEAAKKWDLEGAGSEWTSEEENGMRAYSCPSCGAQLICEETTAATSCPYCGNPTIIPGQFSGSKRPDYVIPFKVDKDTAVKNLKQYYEGKFLLPSTFTKQNHVEEIKGVYVPFWLFDAKADALATFYANTISVHREGDYEVTTTRHFDVLREGTISFERIPVDGSSKMPDEYMDSIEPFDYGDIKDFSTAYMPGYLADKYDQDALQAATRADERCRNSAIESLRETVVGYNTVETRRREVRLERGKVKYAMMPVWMLSTKWNGKNYLFAMNGQTGKMVGDLPVDKNKLMACCAACGAAFAAVFWMLGRWLF